MARGDAAHHWNEAQQILDGDPGLRDRVPWKGPGYSYFLAGLMSVFGRSAGALRWAMALLGALNCAALVLLARQVLSPAGSVIAGLLAAVNGVLIFFDGELLFPTLLISLNLPVLWLLGRGDAGWKSHAAAGGLLGAASLVHPVFLVPALALAAWAARRNRRHGAVLALAVGLAITPSFLTNMFLRDQPVLISWNGGINLYVGNHPAFDQYSGNRTSAWARILQSPIDAGVPGESERDRMYYGLAIRQAAASPVRTVGTLVRKAIILILPVEYANNIGIYELREHSPVLAATLGHRGPLWWPFGMWGPIALIGLALMLFQPRSPASGVLAVWSLGLAATIVISFNTSRYRAPLVFFGCIWAAYALNVAWSDWRAGKRRRVAMGAVIAIVLAAVLALMAVPQRGYPLPLEFNEAALLASRGSFDRAQGWIDRALARAPEDAQLRHAVAGFYARQDMRTDEREQLQRMLAVDDPEPDLQSIGHQLLARSYAQDGQFDAARRHIDAALNVGVDSATWKGRAYYQLGLGPVTACWLRLQAADIELDAGNPARARELMLLVESDCGRQGRLKDKLEELEVQVILAEPRLAPAEPEDVTDRSRVSPASSGRVAADGVTG
jgi:tetratricopeptide (TPR) repeat protein